MKPAAPLLMLLLAWVLLGLACAIANAREWWLAADLNLAFWLCLPVIAALALADARSITRKPQLLVSRRIDPHLALGVQQTVNLRISNQSPLLQKLRVTDTPGHRLKVSQLPVDVVIEPGHNANIAYRVFPIVRGLARFDKVCCLVSSRWRLWQKTHVFGEPTQSRIYPNYKPLFRSTFINSEKLVNELGVQISQRRGEGADFRQLREFRSGDSLRQVDWRATARFHRPISREYQEERDQQVIFMLDCGRRMRAMEGDISHFDHALNAFLISAFIALRQGDSVGLLSFAGQPRWVPPVKGRNQVSHLLEQIYDLHSSLETSDFIEASQQLISRFPRRALVIMMSTIEPEDHDDLSRAISMLSRHHLVMLANIRPQALTQAIDANINNLDDALRLCGATLHQQKQLAMLAALRANHIIVTDTPASRMHASLISEYLSLKRSGAF